MKFKEIIGSITIWLGIFIVGSLVVTFLVVPGSFQSFKYNIDSIGKKIKVEKNIEEIETIEVEVPWFLSSCSQLEVGARANQMSGSFIKEKTCTSSCGEKEKEFSHFKCRIDKLRCYCIK